MSILGLSETLGLYLNNDLFVSDDSHCVCHCNRPNLIAVCLISAIVTIRVVLGWAYRGLTGGFLLLQNFSVAISVSPHVCFILVLILISMFLR